MLPMDVDRHQRPLMIHQARVDVGLYGGDVPSMVVNLPFMELCHLMRR